MISNQTKKLLVLKKLKGVGHATLEIISKVEGFELKSVEEIVESVPKLKKILSNKDALSEAEEKAHVDINESEKNNSKIISILDDEYPAILRGTYDKPIILYISGQMPKLPSVAIIGTREPTTHGEEITRRISKYFCDNGWSVVSGLALGCDSIAHKATIDNNGHTTAVLAHGLHTIAPKQNKKLADEILSTGGTLLSEYEFGADPMPYQFAARDRIQAGLSQGVIMIQSDIGGGSLIASRSAIKYGRTLGVPNPTELDKRGKEKKIEANLMLVGNEDSVKQKLLNCSPFEMQNLFVINNRDDYHSLLKKMSVY